MAQFDVRRTQGAASQLAPYLVELQSDLLEARSIRVVAPLYAASTFGPAIRTLQVPLVLSGEHYVLAIDELAAVPAVALGTAMGSVAEHRGAIIAALDLLFTGI